MKLFLPLHFGVRAARRHLGLVLLVYLLSLLPALAVGALAWFDMAPQTGHSLFARQALEGNRMGVWNDYIRADASDFGLVSSGLLVAAAAALLLAILTAAGVVEALLVREHRHERPFLLGIGRHGWRFVRSAVWFTFAAAVLATLVSLGFTGINKWAGNVGNGWLQVWGWTAVLVAALLVYMPLDLGYDLSRIAAAAHDDGRTFVGYWKALGHVLRHPLLLAPSWLVFSLLVIGVHLAYVTGRAFVQPGNLGEVALVFLVQQLVFLVAAFLRVGLWGGEIAYYQAVGEPRWCARTRRSRRQRQRDVEEAEAAVAAARAEQEAAARPQAEPMAPAAVDEQPVWTREEPMAKPRTETEPGDWNRTPTS